MSISVKSIGLLMKTNNISILHDTEGHLLKELGKLTDYPWILLTFSTMTDISTGCFTTKNGLDELIGKVDKLYYNLSSKLTTATGIPLNLPHQVSTENMAAVFAKLNELDSCFYCTSHMNKKYQVATHAILSLTAIQLQSTIGEFSNNINDLEEELKRSTILGIASYIDILHVAVHNMITAGYEDIELSTWAIDNLMRYVSITGAYSTVH